MAKQRLFFDMDGTLFKWRNIKLNIKKEEDIEDIEKMVFDILYQPRYFISLPPYVNMIETVNRFIAEDEFDVYILSCVLPDKGNVSPAEQKLKTILTYIKDIDLENILFVPDGQDKRKFIPDGIRENDVLIDDCTTKNLIPWSEKAIGIKVLNGMNGKKGVWKGSTINYLDNPEKIMKDIKTIAKENTLIRNGQPKADKSIYDPIAMEDIEAE